PTTHTHLRWRIAPRPLDLQLVLGPLDELPNLHVLHRTREAHQLNLRVRENSCQAIYEWCLDRAHDRATGPTCALRTQKRGEMSIRGNGQARASRLEYRIPIFTWSEQQQQLGLCSQRFSDPVAVVLRSPKPFDGDISRVELEAPCQSVAYLMKSVWALRAQLDSAEQL